MKQRYISLDIMRGIALFGILLINIPAYLVAVEGSDMGLPSMITGDTVDLWD